MEKQEILFKAGDGGYFAYRIPVLVTTNEDTLIAFTEARIGTASDYASIDLVYKRKEKGKEWSEPIKFRGNGVDTFHNPAIIVDGDKLHLFYGINYLRIFHLISYDDGLTFTDEQEITGVYPLVPYTAIAVGPGRGVKAHGKLIAPTWIAIGTQERKHANSFIGVLYSEDGGKEWKFNPISVPIAISPNESMLVALPSGKVLINCRHNSDKRWRVVLTSDDGINFTDARFDETLTEQRVMASIIDTDLGIMFSNPAYADSFNDWVDRKGLAVRLSTDECESWAYTRTVCKDWSGYSHLAQVGNEYYLLYETNLGEKSAMDLALFTFDEKWIKGE